jgi:transcriptional regulator with XRE-family HTH domain
MTVKERLIEYLKSKKISKSDFGKTIGVSSSYVTSIRKSIDKDKLRSIALNFPDLNINWLLYGEGQMLKKNEDVSPQNESENEIILVLVEKIEKLNKRIGELEAENEHLRKLQDVSARKRAINLDDNKERRTQN